MRGRGATDRNNEKKDAEETKREGLPLQSSGQEKAKGKKK